MKQKYLKIYQESLDGMSLKEISKKYEIPYTTLYSYFKANNITINKANKRRNFVDDNFLDELDSEDKAYFLGMMFADGYVVKNKISLKLKSSDSYLIKKLFSKFTNGYNLSKDKNSKSIQITSTKLVKKLIELGCTERQTNNDFKVIELKNDLFRHYLRGYFDGDGSISLRKSRPNQVQIYICSIHKKFLEELKTKLNNYNINCLVFKESRNGKLMKTPQGKILLNCKDMYTLRFGTHIDRIKLFEFLYKDCSIKLDRKYKIFSEYYANTVLTLESKNSKAVQRIEGETIINYQLLSENVFKCGKEINKDLIISLFNQGICKYQIHKKTNIERGIIDKIIKEYKPPRVSDNL